MDDEGGDQQLAAAPFEQGQQSRSTIAMPVSRL
jgi:hypothetical protein